MTVGAMLDQMSAREFREWRIYEHVMYEESERRAKAMTKKTTPSEDEELG